MEQQRVRVCFVCTGNICRSPLAESLFRHEITRRGLEDQFRIDSAGLDAYHVGESPDSRMRAVAGEHGVSVTGSARRFSPAEMNRYDYVVAMDRGHLRTLNRFGRAARNGVRVELFREYDPVRDDPDYPDVPDPWYGGRDGFEKVYEIVSRTCGAFADALIDGLADARQ